jgi:hypothetical protein
MKDTSIRFRISDCEKTRIEDFAHRSGRTMSEILRMAVAEAISGDVPGTDARRSWANLRRSSNSLLDIMETSPINIPRLRAACVSLRNAAQQLVQ